MRSLLGDPCPHLTSPGAPSERWVNWGAHLPTFSYISLCYALFAVFFSCGFIAVPWTPSQRPSLPCIHFGRVFRLLVGTNHFYLKINKSDHHIVLVHSWNIMKTIYKYSTYEKCVMKIAESFFLQEKKSVLFHSMLMIWNSPWVM